MSLWDWLSLFESVSIIAAGFTATAVMIGFATGVLRLRWTRD